MGIREALNQNPAITTGATAGLIVVALVFIFWTTFGGDRSAAPTAPQSVTQPSASPVP